MHELKKEDFPCNIGTKVYFAFADTGNIEEDIVVERKLYDNTFCI